MLWFCAFASLPTFPWLFSCSHEGRSSESACRYRPRPTSSSCRGRRRYGSVILAVTANAVFQTRPSTCDHTGSRPMLRGSALFYPCDCPGLPNALEGRLGSDFRRGHTVAVTTRQNVLTQLAHSAPRCPLRSSIAQQKRQALAFLLRRAPMVSSSLLNCALFLPPPPLSSLVFGSFSC